MRIKSLLLSVLLYSIFVNCLAQSADKRLDKDLTEVHKTSNFPGFAVAIIKDDSVIFSKGYGYADKKLKIPYTVETIQPVASVSKTFVALALMKCVELGYFNLETNINDVLPFKIMNPNFANEVIKIKHLATHTSSLIDNRPPAKVRMI